MRSLFIGTLAVLLLKPVATFAAQIDQITPAQLGVSAAPLTSSPSFTKRVYGFSTATLVVAYTHGAATALNVACVAGPNSGALAPTAIATVSGGTITLADGTFSYPVTVSGNKRLTIAPLNDQLLSCVFTGTGANSSDLVTAYLQLTQ